MWKMTILLTNENLTCLFDVLDTLTEKFDIDSSVPLSFLPYNI